MKITEITEETKAKFIKEHLKTCNAMPMKKYDKKKKESALHSIEYSKKKCAKSCWKKAVKIFLKNKENGK